MDIFTIENFLNDNDINLANALEGKEESFFDTEGVYKGKITSTQQWINPSSEFAKYMQNKFNAIEQLKNNTIDGLQILRAKNPYDVHSDWIVQNNQVPIADPKINPPLCTIVIPLVAGDYNTIIFDQEATYNNFSDYKKHNTVLENYCPDSEWQKYCSHCHKEDQKYLTIKEIFNWQKGTLFAFDRKLFHCSSNFGTSSKKAIVAWLSR
jgi:hypothetical protein